MIGITSDEVVGESSAAGSVASRDENASMMQPTVMDVIMRRMKTHPLWAAVVLFAVITIAGCGAAQVIDVGTGGTAGYASGGAGGTDGGGPDAGATDDGPVSPDAPISEDTAVAPPDGPAPDAYIPPPPCANDVDGTACGQGMICLNRTCVPTQCGDGFVDRAANEECDDKNEVTTDACVACKRATCGDGFVRAGVEECDDRNTTPRDGCENNCLWTCKDNNACSNNNACDGIETCNLQTHTCQPGTPVVPSGSQSYTFTGTAAVFVVPACVTSIVVDAYGAQGGTGDPSAIGGRGGRARARIPVTPGETLQVRVGGMGASGVINQANGGFNGGGGALEAVLQNAGPSGTGGGASDVRRGDALTGRLVVAAGGGGGGWTNATGGGGGGLNGINGTVSSSSGYAAGGGATQTMGGSVGWAMGSYTNQPGAFGVGGTCYHDGAGCGGGGGGWYGGGTGGFAGGGGGSSYVDAPGNTDKFTEPAVRTGNGLIQINW